MRILNAKAHVALGQTFLLTTLLFVAMILGLLPDRDGAVLEGRTQLAEAIAANGSALVTRRDLERLEATLGLVVERNPDLLSAGLTLERVAEGPSVNGVVSLHLGYRGARGCRLSLFVLPLGLELGEQMLDISPGAEAGANRQAVAWQSAGRSNLLLTEGMDPLRFAEIARRVYRASVEQRPFDAETRQALQRSHAQGARCQA